MCEILQSIALKVYDAAVLEISLVNLFLMLPIKQQSHSLQFVPWSFTSIYQPFPLQTEEDPEDIYVGIAVSLY